MALSDHGEKWIDVDGISTRYVEAGAGRTVVLIHGGQAGDATGGASAEDFGANFAALAENFHVIAVDRLGQGQTDNPNSDDDWTIGASVRHLSGFLKAYGGGPYNLIGHSRGGYAALCLTLDHPTLVESCVLINSNTAAPGAGRNEAVFACNPHAPGTIEAARYNLGQSSFSSVHVSEDWLAHKQALVESEKGKAATAKMFGEGFFATRFLPALVSDKDRLFARIESEGVSRPVLIVWGYDDPTAPVDLGLRLYDLIAEKQGRTQFLMLNKAGHYSFRERVDAFNRAVTDFLEGVAHGN